MLKIALVNLPNIVVDKNLLDINIKKKSFGQQ